MYEYLYWIILGVLSSVGFGTGLHTFLLYLVSAIYFHRFELVLLHPSPSFHNTQGPYIAHITQAAYVCDSFNFNNIVYSPSRDTYQSFIHSN